MKKVIVFGSTGKTGQQIGHWVRVMGKTAEVSQMTDFNQKLRLNGSFGGKKSRQDLCRLKSHLMDPVPRPNKPALVGFYLG